MYYNLAIMLGLIFILMPIATPLLVLRKNLLFFIPPHILLKPPPSVSENQTLTFVEECIDHYVPDFCVTS